MKIAISSAGKDIDSDVDNVFGRCPFFIFADIEGKKITKVEAIKNISAEKTGGAGISAAQAVAEKGAKAVITGNVGPRAMDVLRQFNIEIYNGSGTVKEALQGFIDGKLGKVQ
jgi:predicted Fe-Mo cluster-binding NifX family protein